MSHTHFYIMKFILLGGLSLLLYTHFVRIRSHILSDIIMLVFLLKLFIDSILYESLNMTQFLGYSFLNTVFKTSSLILLLAHSMARRSALFSSGTMIFLKDVIFTLYETFYVTFKLLLINDWLNDPIIFQY